MKIHSHKYYEKIDNIGGIKICIKCGKTFIAEYLRVGKLQPYCKVADTFPKKFLKDLQKNTEWRPV